MYEFKKVEAGHYVMRGDEFHVCRWGTKWFAHRVKDHDAPYMDNRVGGPFDNMYEAKRLCREIRRDEIFAEEHGTYEE